MDGSLRKHYQAIMAVSRKLESGSEITDQDISRCQRAVAVLQSSPYANGDDSVIRTYFRGVELLEQLQGKEVPLAFQRIDWRTAEAQGSPVHMTDRMRLAR